MPAGLSTHKPYNEDRTPGYPKKFSKWEISKANITINLLFLLISCLKLSTTKTRGTATNLGW